MRLTIAACAAAFALLTSAAHASDRICDYLRAFERAPFEIDSAGNAKFRWIDFHWYGNWMDLDKGWHLECQPSDSNASRAFCNWLQENTSFEFAEYLPMRILYCRGYPVKNFSALDRRWTWQLLIFLSRLLVSMCFISISEVG